MIGRNGWPERANNNTKLLTGSIKHQAKGCTRGRIGPTNNDHCNAGLSCHHKCGAKLSASRVAFWSFLVGVILCSCARSLVVSRIVVLRSGVCSVLVLSGVCLFLVVCLSVSLFLFLPLVRLSVCRLCRWAQVILSSFFFWPTVGHFLDPTVGFPVRIAGFVAFYVPGVSFGWLMLFNSMLVCCGVSGPWSFAVGGILMRAAYDSSLAGNCW